jgi:hypothetical protein
LEPEEVEVLPPSSPSVSVWSLEAAAVSSELLAASVESVVESEVVVSSVEVDGSSS